MTLIPQICPTSYISNSLVQCKKNRTFLLVACTLPYTSLTCMSHTTIGQRSSFQQPSSNFLLLTSTFVWSSHLQTLSFHPKVSLLAKPSSESYLRSTFIHRTFSLPPFLQHCPDISTCPDMTFAPNPHVIQGLVEHSMDGFPNKIQPYTCALWVGDPQGMGVH